MNNIFHYVEYVHEFFFFIREKFNKLTLLMKLLCLIKIIKIFFFNIKFEIKLFIFFKMSCFGTESILEQI